MARGAKPSRVNRDSRQETQAGVTVSSIITDRLTALSKDLWPNRLHPEQNIYDPAVIENIYATELNAEIQQLPSKDQENNLPRTAQRLQLLEFSSYLESYLWPFYDAASASKAHTFSVVLLINQKFQEGVPAWDSLRNTQDAEAKFPSLIVKVLQYYLETPVLPAAEVPLPESMHREKITLIIFLIKCFQSLEESMVRSVMLRLCSLQLWNSVSRPRREAEFDVYPQLRRHWEHIQEGGPQKKRARKDQDIRQPAISATAPFEATFLPQAFLEFLAVAESFPPAVSAKKAPLAPISASEDFRLRYCERFLELAIDLLSQLPTRRFLKAFLIDKHVGVRLKLAPLQAHSKLAAQLIDSFRFYLNFEINEHTGLPLSAQDIAAQHFARVHILQRLSFRYYKEKLLDLAFASSSSVGDPIQLRTFLARLGQDELQELAGRLRLFDPDNPTPKTLSHETLLEILIDWHTDHLSLIQEINERPLIPSEKFLWDLNTVPLAHSVEAADGLLGGPVMALPKLNLQFLTFVDYLLRSFVLYRAESAYEIRQDLMDTIKYVGARKDPATGETVFAGWARMAAPLSKGGLEIVEVKKPNLGERIPAGVKAEVHVDLTKYQGHLRSEWDQLREHDVIFLVTIENPQMGITSNENGKGNRLKKAERLSEEADASGFCERYGVKYVRGAEIWEVRDQAGNVLNDPSGRPDEVKGGPMGSRRIYKVNLDSAQYHSDVKQGGPGAEVYQGMNLIVRRKAKENNFKAILETIRNLTNTAYVGKAVPPWLHDLFLGYGNPAQANYRSLPFEQQLLRDVDFFDTFLDLDHLRASFPNHKVHVEGGDASGPYPSLMLSFVNETTLSTPKELVAKPYRPPNPGPYPQDQPQRNTVRFTPVQIEAIRSGMNPGLTMVVGPPGTGKTDVAVQIISNLYHAFPGQRILLVTHSNAALNDLFEKIMARDIDPRHLLRLGAGEKELLVNTLGGQYDFTKWGRVNYTLARRLELLGEIQRLATTLGTASDVSYTCETAAYFILHQVQSRIEAFEADVADYRGSTTAKPASFVADKFPFSGFFSTAPQPLFRLASFDEDLEIAKGCFRHLNRLFSELEDYRAFELLRNQTMRGDYLLTKQARVVAMTCTHAALIRSRLVELGFKFDCLVMEEAAQILEVETFIPMLLQDVDPLEGCRLKRVVLIGDHHQLPPIVQNMSLQKFSHMDQSLFARFVRLGVDTVQLDEQGRARPSLASLYNWRYKRLGNLEQVVQHEAYKLANAGFAFDYQLVNVHDFQGIGESAPSPHFYQNVGEAEYVVAVYQYMRLCGYPADKISILTSYNGQKHLIRDVLRQRCALHPSFGHPATVSTVDKYQGQQNDYVLLSLVRTRHIGHIRDVRRLIVAMSRARLGLYVFCRQSLFENCYELQQTFYRLLSRPPVLKLIIGERFGHCSRPLEVQPPESMLYDVTDGVTQMGILVQQLIQNLRMYEQQASVELQSQGEHLANGSDDTQIENTTEDGEV